VTSAPPLELWGGVECSVVRIGDEYRNQVVETGHSARFDDLDAMIGLGVKAVRYPILWETVAPETPTELDFSWHDKRLEHLRQRGIKVIAALVHHGSGPRYTSLLDPKFPDLLADYAAKVARRYPWIDYWNPVNEPMTTARFSCLYGHWHPHLTDIDATFRALVNQCLAIKRSIASGKDEGISEADLQVAFNAEYLENEILPATDVTEDWLKLIDYDPDNVVKITPVRAGGRATSAPPSGVI